MTLDGVRRVLEPALDGDTWSGVLDVLRANRAQLWIEGHSAMITELWAKDGEMDCLHVWLAGGRLRELLALKPKVEHQAREWGCKRVTIAGRMGWGRVLKDYTRRDDELEKML